MNLRRLLFVPVVAALSLTVPSKTNAQTNPDSTATSQTSRDSVETIPNDTLETSVLPYINSPIEGYKKGVKDDKKQDNGDQVTIIAKTSNNNEGFEPRADLSHAEGTLVVPITKKGLKIKSFFTTKLGLANVRPEAEAGPNQSTVGGVEGGFVGTWKNITGWFSGHTTVSNNSNTKPRNGFSLGGTYHSKDFAITGSGTKSMALEEPVVGELSKTSDYQKVVTKVNITASSLLAQLPLGKNKQAKLEVIPTVKGGVAIRPNEKNVYSLEPGVTLATETKNGWGFLGRLNFFHPITPVPSQTKEGYFTGGATITRSLNKNDKN